MPEGMTHKPGDTFGKAQVISKTFFVGRGLSRDFQEHEKRGFQPLAHDRGLTACNSPNGSAKFLILVHFPFSFRFVRKRYSIT